MSTVDYPILIVNDGSNDGLTKIDYPNIIYLSHERNIGKGAALKTGLAHAYRLGYTHAITLDADGQHDPYIIPKFLAQSKLNPGAVVVGNRDLNHQSMPFHRKLSNNITSMMLSLKTGQRIYDSQVGYRVYPLSDSRLWRSDEDGFQFESTVFFNATKLNINIVWIPIQVIYGTEGSHMHLVKDTVRFVRTFCRSFKW